MCSMKEAHPLMTISEHRMAMEMQETTGEAHDVCDVCGSLAPVKGGRSLMAPRPSTGELVEVLWVCSACAPEWRHGEGRNT